MHETQGLNLALMREFARLGVEFAFPTRTVFIASPTQAGEEAARDKVGQPAPASSANGPGGSAGFRSA